MNVNQEAGRRKGTIYETPKPQDILSIPRNSVKRTLSSVYFGTIRVFNLKIVFLTFI